MSVKVQALIWEYAPYRGNALLAFLALGDWSNDDGQCWPKMETLAKKSRQSVRSAQYAVELLCRDGFLTVEINPGKGRQNDFQINMQKLHLLATQKVQTATAKGANGDSKRCKPQQPNKEEPSVDPSKNHERETCSRHPESGLTQWGTCWACYAERCSSEPQNESAPALRKSVHSVAS
jgi:hypothetical protein